MTEGIHHLGLGSAQFEKTVDFFVRTLGFKLVGGVDSYPSKFVSDGKILITIWNIEPAKAVPFDRKTNVGLHHLALKVVSFEKLNELHEALKKESEVKIEFAPQAVGEFAPKSFHMMFYEPGGIRIELWADKQ